MTSRKSAYGKNAPITQTGKLQADPTSLDPRAGEGDQSHSAVRTRSSPLRRARDRLHDSRGGARLLDGVYRVVVPVARRGNETLRRLSSCSHLLQYKIEGLLAPNAHWFDHEIDAQWQWQARGRSTFLERGVLNSLVIGADANVLDMCSGDGFHADRFYSARAARVLGVDNDRSALRHARRYHARPNVEYQECDITEALPEGPFNNVVWDAAMLMFTTEQTRSILARAHAQMTATGVFSGYTVVDADESNRWSAAQMHFTGADQLVALLEQEFAAVAVLETSDTLRGNLYFFAADDAASLPFAVGVTRPH